MIYVAVFLVGMAVGTITEFVIALRAISGGKARGENMDRLIESDGRGKWKLKGLEWSSLRTGEKITEETSAILCKALWKLKAYEESGLSPEEVQAMIELYNAQPPKRMPDEVVDHIMDRFTKHT